MSMRDSLHIPEEDLIQYALGNLKETQLSTMTAHISLCNVCRDELARTLVDLAAYASVQPLSEVPAGARERFMTRLSNDTADTSKLVKMRNRSRVYIISKSFKNWLETPMPLKILSGALAAVAVFLAYDDLAHIHQIRQLLPEMKRFEAQNAEFEELRSFLQGTHVQQVSLHEKPSLTKSPEGHAIYSATGGKLVFTATNMAAPPPGKAYELWLLPVKGAPIPAGMFTPDLQGSAAVIFPPIPADVQAGGFGVTLEDAAGSPAPTSAILLSGQ
jgi:anti-sigma-K factor RskA